MHNEIDNGVDKLKMSPMWNKYKEYLTSEYNIYRQVSHLECKPVPKLGWVDKKMME